MPSRTLRYLSKPSLIRFIWLCRYLRMCEILHLTPTHVVFNGSLLSVVFLPVLLIAGRTLAH